MILKRTLFLITLLVCVADLSAQHYGAWLRGTLQLPLGKGWSTASEFQYRWQNNLGTSNPFQSNQLQSYRHWIYYRVNNSVQFELSPFAYYVSYRTIQREGDDHKAPAGEIRTTAAVILEQKIAKQLAIVNRTAVEYRALIAKSDVTRLRHKIGLRYNFGRWSFNAYNEQFLNISNFDKDPFFDQSRLGLSVSHNLTRNLKVELGYLHLVRLPGYAADALYEHNCAFNISYKL